jgi:hypothetical protein
MFNALSKEQVNILKPGEKITACDFDMKKLSFAIGLNNGNAELVNMKTLSVESIFSCGSELMSNPLPIMALNWKFPEHLVVGYEDGTINDFPIGSPLSPTVFIPPFKVEEFPTYPPVSYIKSSLTDSFILVCYNHKDSATVFGYKAGTNETTTKIVHVSGIILDMNVIEWAQVLITLSSVNNEMSIYNYLHGDFLVSLRVNIEGITFQNPLTSFTVLPINKQIMSVYKVKEEKSKGDIIACGMKNGTILIAYLDIKFDKEKISATINPQQLYKTQEMAENSAEIRVIHLDPVTDNMLVGDANGNVVIFKNSLMQALNPLEAKKREEENKRSWLGKIWGREWSSEKLEEIDTPANVEVVDTNPIPGEFENLSEDSKQ